ncbi:nuclease-related domain-containing protein [Oceanobacillus senegalensis]|uniref:nuclease-related domain-containing protein n=1 Tax=Oceanobacillus senegalensis TaxID=1936063 RepID=UPI00117E2189|nr:nuclease-related domain-containing protein [Oceanobacillus senegalensis]
MNIIKPRHKNQEVMALRALDARVPTGHPMKEKVQTDLKIKLAEVSGEREVDYPLGFLDKKQYLILHNLRLPDNNGHFQMDTVLLSQNFILIVEVKNWLGTVIFGENDQVTRIYEGKEKGYHHPVPQARTQAFRLYQWLRKQGVPNIPIEILAVISFPSTIIKPSSPHVHIPNEVIHNSNLLFRIQELEKKYDKKVISKRQQDEVAHLLKNSDHPPSNNILDKYHLHPNDLLKGVFCPECRSLPMIRCKRKWYCTQCHHYSIDAHRFTLLDYQLLIGCWITNRAARAFLNISSPYIMKRILQQECISHIGKGKGMRYKLGYNIME